MKRVHSQTGFIMNP